ncbi:MAG: hypothetical protein B6I37_04095 [Desulfobacteraceae bacterium 4572_35.2]|nr:MAG: hypothetical protein B6I37_04095 [Desulfobacteraceae bacterium 4572_35.2]
MRSIHSDEIHGRYLDSKILRRFLPFVRPYWKKALAGLLLLPLISVVRIVPPLLIKLAIDESILPGDLSKLLPISAVLVALLIVEGGLVFGQSLSVQMVGQYIMADLRRDSFAKLMRLPRSWYDWQASGRLLTRLTTDVEHVGDLFGSGIVSAIGDIFTLVMIFIIMMTINVPLSLISFAVVPLLIAVIALIRRPMRTVMRQLRARQASLNAFITERLNGIAEVQIFSQEQRTSAEFDDLQDDYRHSALRWVSLEAMFYASVHIFGSLAVAAILWKGGGEVMRGAATFGTLVAFIEYSRKFFMPLTDLASKFSVLQTSNASLERIFDLLDQPEEDQGTLAVAAGPGRVEFCDVRFSYVADEQVLKGVSFTLEPGKCVALVGETGSGKSTLQVFEHLRHTRAHTVVERLGGLDGQLVEHGKNLSSGERQLLCLTRTQIQDPQVIILDEATSHLDGDSEELVYQAMRAVAGGRATLMVVHHLRLAAEADLIVVLHQGHVCEQGSHRQLLEKQGRYAQLWQIQQLDSQG